MEKAESRVSGLMQIAGELVGRKAGRSNLRGYIPGLRERMTRAGSHIRNMEDVELALKECREELERFSGGLLELSGASELPDAFRVRDMLITQLVYLSAVAEYIRKGGRSRGSYLIRDSAGKLPVPGLPEEFRYSLDSGELMKQLCEISLEQADGAFCCRAEWKQVRPVPQEDNWFENVWNEYMKGDIIK